MTELEAEAECPYHHRRWRGQLQCLLNGLRGSVLQERHIRMFPTAVCVCTDKSRSSPRNQLSNLAETKAWFESPGDGGAALKPVRPIIDRFIASASDESLDRETREAITAVLSLIKDACNGNYQQLEADLKQSPRNPNQREEMFDLDLPSDCVGLFLGKRGRHIKPICRKHSVSVKLGDGQSSTWRGRISGSSVRVLVRYSGGQEQLDEVKEELRRRAEEACSRWQQQPHDTDEGSYWDPYEESYEDCSIC